MATHIKTAAFAASFLLLKDAGGLKAATKILPSGAPVI